MTEVAIRQVDERDSNWEDNRPRFRVYLHGSGATSTRGRTDTYDVTGADVLQVIDWAQRQAGDSLTYAIALVYDDDDMERRNPTHGRGLVWLVGMDGNDTTEDDESAQIQQRMLVRRHDPVRLPPADRMPADVPHPYDHGTKQR